MLKAYGSVRAKNESIFNKKDGTSGRRLELVILDDEDVDSDKIEVTQADYDKYQKGDLVQGLPVKIDKREYNGKTYVTIKSFSA